MKIPQNKFKFAPSGLKKILGDEPWHIRQDGTLDWLSEKISEPEESVILAKIDEAEQDFINNLYQRDRASAYPSYADQFDEIYHNGIDSWKAVIKVTKDKYPKG